MTFYGIPPAGLRRFLAPDSGRDHGRLIVDDACSWWAENRSGASGLAVAVGTLAGLALCAPSRVDGPDYGPLLLPLDDEGLVDTLRACWNTVWAVDPVLADVARPLHAWLDGTGDDESRGLADYARILVRAGVLEFCSDVTRCESADVLGMLVHRLRGRGLKEATGEFFTPVGAADHLSEVLTSDRPEPGRVWLEPCAGTGTLVRAAAAALRFEGLDPGLYHWWLNDIDPLNAACCAVNARLWRLGRSVTVSCGDALRDPRDLEEPALDRAERAIAERMRRPLLYPTWTRSPYWPL